MKRRGFLVVLLVTGILLSSASVGVFQAAERKMMPGMQGRVMAKSKYGFDETVSRLKQAIEGQNLMVIQTVDMQAMIRMTGLETKGIQQLLFFHPRYGKAVYEGDRMGGIEAPLKIIVMEGDMGTMISYYKPSHLFSKYAKLKELGKELDVVLKKIEETVTK